MCQIAGEFAALGSPRSRVPTANCCGGNARWSPEEPRVPATGWSNWRRKNSCSFRPCAAGRKGSATGRPIHNLRGARTGGMRRPRVRTARVGSGGRPSGEPALARVGWNGITIWDGACPSVRTCVTGRAIAIGNWLVCCGPRRPGRCRRGMPGLARVTNSGNAGDRQHYGVRPLLLETLVDAVRFPGTCYRAANWADLRPWSHGPRAQITR
jgi:hypothetical protein